MNFPRRSARGFTLIEIIIVIAISAVLATIAIAYNAGVRDEVALSVETAKVSQTILNAKALALATYTGIGSDVIICGYGVYFNMAANEYSIFQYVPAGLTCPTLASTTVDGVTPADMQEYSQSTWDIPLANGVKLVSGGHNDDLAAVFFYPPMPATLISTSTASPYVFAAGEGTVYLETIDGSSSSTVSVTPGGQVDYE
jgi:prepilin-type N-terminal cleavage/methylation domain-containing protein